MNRCRREQTLIGGAYRASTADFSCSASSCNCSTGNFFNWSSNVTAWLVAQLVEFSLSRGKFRTPDIPLWVFERFMGLDAQSQAEVGTGKFGVPGIQLIA
jgi:hypothetical protein